MRAFVMLTFLASLLFAAQSYVDALVGFLHQKSFRINGFFYMYDFNKNGRIERNDWIYISNTPNPLFFRLMGRTPTSDDAFGWLRLASLPSDLDRQKPAGYFIKIDFPLDYTLYGKRHASAFSWIYITQNRVYKLMGAKPNHDFDYLDIDGDGRPDPLPIAGITIEQNASSVTFDTNKKSIYAISAGWYHTCVIAGSDKHAICWGSNRFGELGIGSSSSTQMPRKVRALSHITTISASKEYTCASLEDGSAWCWGRNQYGKLGNGKVDKEELSFLGFASSLPFTQQRYAPLPQRVLTQPGKALEDVQSVEAGSWHGCALLRNSKVMCWGENMYGALGIGLRPNDKNSAQLIQEYLLQHKRDIFKYLLWPYALNVIEQPLNPKIKMPTRIFDNVKMVAAGSSDHTCALLNDGSVKCWGWHGGYELGFAYDEDYAPNPFFTVKNPDGTPLRDVKKIIAGGDHTCALLHDGMVKCWGLNDFGQLGDNTTSPSTYAIYVRKRNGEIFDNVKDIASERGYHTCAITNKGELYCWGDNHFAQLARTPSAAPYIPYPVKIDLLKPVKLVAAGGGGTSPFEGYIYDGEHTCAVTIDDQIYCWGSNRYGQIDPHSNKEIITTPHAITLP